MSIYDKIEIGPLILQPENIYADAIGITLMVDPDQEDEFGQTYGNEYSTSVNVPVKAWEAAQAAHKRSKNGH